MIRKCCVAGSFYPADEKQLFDTVKKYILAGKNTNEIVQGIVVPHAGYIYSGKVAGLTYSEVAIPDKVIIIGPNHTGMGEAVSVMTEGVWEMPQRKVRVDLDLAESIIKNSTYAKDDNEAHLMEHSIEVQLPFILFKNPALSFVPIIVSSIDIALLEDVAESIASSIEAVDDDVLIIASSDMSHYVPQKEAEHLDNLAIEKIKSLDYRGLLKTVAKEHISMCGAAPVAIMLKAAKILKASKGELVHYNTSAETSGDTGQVVGYAGVKIK